MNTYLSWPHGVIQFITESALEHYERLLKRDARERELAYAALVAKGRC